jgi:hypothetical protein
MQGEVTVMTTHWQAVYIKVGDRVRMKNARRSFPLRIKQKEMVYRLLKKPFKPYLKVTFVETKPDYVNFHLQPANF